MLKKVLFVTIASIVSSQSYSFENIENDKKLHFTASYFIGTGANILIQDPYKSFAVCMGVGVAKEAYDYIDYGLFSADDLVYDGIGCVLGVYTGEVINFYYKNETATLSYQYNF